MAATVFAEMSMGFRATSNHAFFALSDADKKAFKMAFVAELEDSQEGIAPNVRNNWRNLPYSADTNGHLSETFIASELDAMLQSYSAPKAEFELDTTGPIEVIYIWINGKQYCHHKYWVKRAVNGGAFVSWEFSETYGSTQVTAEVTIDFSWSCIY